VLLYRPTTDWTRDMTAEIKFSTLTPSDTTCVYDLYQRVAVSSPYGFLTEKSMDDISAVLRCAEHSASIGAWSRGRLVAYSLCVRAMEDVFSQSPLFRLIERRREPLWNGKGTVVDPQFEGRLLMPRLLARRYRLIHERSPCCHIAGMVAYDNISSLIGAFRAGSWAVGLEDDQYCRNVVFYAGSLTNFTVFGAKCAVKIEDLEGLSAKFAGGWVGTGTTKDRINGQRRLILKQATIAGESLGI